MNVCWFSAGVSSFVAAWLMRAEIDEFIYTHIDDQHPDTMRFVLDCQQALGEKINILQSPYKSVDNVIQQFRFINSRYGAKCTQILKKRVRKEWEYRKRDLNYVWGFDCTEEHRVDQILEMMPEFTHKFPLIEKKLTKNDAHGVLKMIGIKRPAMYDLGYHNNNCIGCVKGGMGYWNKIRVDFPDVFKRRATQERDIKHTCIKGVYLDELEPDRGNLTEEITEECSLICHMAI